MTLPAYLGELHHPGEHAQARLDSRGVLEHWLTKDEWLDWNFEVSSPGEFDVAIITSEQKYGNGWEGGHRVAVSVAGSEIHGVISNDGNVDNPSNPYWPYVLSHAGRVRIAQTGAYSLALKPEAIETRKQLGITLVDVKLTPVK